MGGLKNEIGNTYGYLTVIDRAENTKDGRAQWLCQCKCGNQTIVLGKHLRSGNTKSCGCYQKEKAAESNMNRANNLINKRFGKLLVLREYGFIKDNNKKNHRLYECLCDCGNITYAQHQYLEYGDVISCGCLRSKGEFQIEQLLKQHNINFKREFSFSDLKDIDVLRFDFAIFDKNNDLYCLIEFQGSQHYNKSNGYYSETLIKHDKMKIDYCKNNNIKLNIIKYKRNHDLFFEELGLEDLNEL